MNKVTVSQLFLCYPSQKLSKLFIFIFTNFLQKLSYIFSFLYHFWQKNTPAYLPTQFTIYSKVFKTSLSMQKQLR